MASVGDIVTIWGNVSKVMSIVTDVEQNSSVISEEFRHEVNILRERLALYADQVSSVDEPVQNLLREILSKAQHILDGAEPRLLSLQEMQENIDNSCCCSYGWWLYAKLSLFFLPEKLEKTLKKVTDEINRIPEVLKEFMAQAGPSRNNTLTAFYDNSDLYVHIKSGRDVITAIDNLDGRRIVLLHGGVGTGKSTLARHVCALYGEEGENKGLFKHVMLVLCGGNRSKLIPSAKQYEIVQFLSSKNSSYSPEKRETSQQERIENDLQKLLGEDKVLIILDDVADPEFLKKMWDACRRGKHVKFFVTSQKSDLCRLLKTDSLAIEMEEPTMEEARKIVASHVGLEDKMIPANLQGLADAMITATGSNPLALACLTSKFPKGGHETDETAWAEALRRLTELLNEPEKIGVYGEYHASRGVWAAIKLCLDSLESIEAKDILLLMYACKGESIPEEVLKIWYHRVPKSSSLFAYSIGELSTRQLLKSTPGTVMPEMRTWSLRPLLKLYMDQDVFLKKKMRPLLADVLGGDNKPGWYKRKRKSCFGDWLGGNRAGPDLDSGVKRDSDSEKIEREKTRVATVLRALYFDPAHTNKVVSDVATQALNLINNPNDLIHDLRRKAIEPIIWLLDKLEARVAEKDGTWTQADISCVRQVFLEYVCEQQLDDNKICVLLKLTSYPSAPLATLTALGNIFQIEEKPLLNRDQLRFLTLIVEILGSNDPIKQNIREAASNALESISDKAVRENATGKVASTPRILPVLVSLIQNSIHNSIRTSDDVLAQNAASALSSMAYGDDDLLTSQILNEPGVLASLVTALSKDENPELQENASLALSNLAFAGDTIQSQILREAGALVGLVTALSKEENPKLQEYAANALCSLAFGGEEIKSQILREAGPIGGLVKALSKDENPNLQEYAAWALSNLACGGEEIKSQILREAGALGGLVTALSKDENRKLKEFAAKALLDLACGGEEIKSQILREAGALAGLVTALSKDENPKLQKFAAKALCNLAFGGEEIKSQILREAGALAGLVTALSKDENPKLQEFAAKALCNLACGGEEIKSQILREAWPIGGLVKALSKDENPNLQEYAAWALRNLACGGEEIKSQILREAGAVGGLVTALSKDENPKLQEYAAKALCNLAFGGEKIKSQILREAGALAGLVTALSKDENPKLQEFAAKALCNLACGGEEIKSQILREAWPIGGLVKALSKDENPNLQEYAAWALRNLACGGEEIKSQILREAGAVGGLVMALSKDENPNLQEYVANALSNLAFGGEEIQSQILREAGALGGLVTALSKDENPKLQEYAAKALSNLAFGGEEIQSQILREAGALGGLVTALSKDENPKLQEFAAKALCIVAFGGEEIKSQILREAGPIGGLVKALSKDENPNLQEYAALALFNLAVGGEGIKSQILREAGALGGLVTALSKDENPKLQEYAAKALSNLGCGGEASKSLIVCDRSV